MWEALGRAATRRLLMGDAYEYFLWDFAARKRDSLFCAKMRQGDPTNEQSTSCGSLASCSSFVQGKLGATCRERERTLCAQRLVL